MIEVSVEKRHGAATVRFGVIAESIKRAIELAGEDARVVFPIDPERFFVRGKRRRAPCGTRPRRRRPPRREAPGPRPGGRPSWKKGRPKAARLPQ
jgi:hypothetical protein